MYAVKCIRNREHKKKVKRDNKRNLILLNNTSCIFGEWLLLMPGDNNKDYITSNLNERNNKKEVIQANRATTINQAFKKS